ncbi:MAG: hypothetical protein E6G61_10570, partial [Actinobacteria bacterium]
AAAITESISMGAVGYTSSVSQRDYYQAERAREAEEIDTIPEAERQEIREIYATKGFSGDLLEGVVDTITANRDSWLATMMDEELHLQPVQTADIFRSAFLITIATLIGHLIPLLPFVWLARTPALVLAIALSAVVLFGVGVYSAVTLVGDWRKSGLKMLVIGLGAAGVGFLIGNLFHAPAPVIPSESTHRDLHAPDHVWCGRSGSNESETSVVSGSRCPITYLSPKTSSWPSWPASSRI